jgi:hypothetical protein
MIADEASEIRRAMEALRKPIDPLAGMQMAWTCEACGRKYLVIRGAEPAVKKCERCI